jgi:3-hydroxyacyl-[acyl-carrier-protein] dehydratase
MAGDSSGATSFEEIRNVLKQRFPILMVDRVLELVPGRMIKTLKNVTGGEIQFLGHFPGLAIMPPVLIMAGVGQSGSILFSKTAEPHPDKEALLVLGAINKMSFYKFVVPGDTMIMEVNVDKMVPHAAIITGTVTVGDEVVARGRLGFASWRSERAGRMTGMKNSKNTRNLAHATRHG